MTNDPLDFAVMAREIIVWSAYLRGQTGWTPSCIDLGGGWTFGKPYGTGPKSQLDNASAPTADDYAKLLCAGIKEECAKQDLQLPKLRMEPGRCSPDSRASPSGAWGP